MMLVLCMGLVFELLFTSHGCYHYWGLSIKHFSGNIAGMQLS